MTHFSETALVRVLYGLIFLGLIYRLYPAATGQPALAQAFITEDGYLMLTVARNIAIGLWMSVSDGTIATNGVQPLATFIFTIPYLLTDGDKTTSLVGIHLILAAFSVAGLFSVRRLAKDVLAPQDDGELWPWLVAALWFVGPLLLLHSMNGLETGLYTVMVSFTIILFGAILGQGDEADLRARLIFGAVCGVTFLTRNDAVFLLSAIWTVWALHDLLVVRRPFMRVIADLLPPGILSILVASPWLINNYVNFGSIVPVSGTAQSLSGGLARNMDLVPAVIFEHMLPMLPVPHSIQYYLAFQIIAMVFVIGVLGSFFLSVWWRGGAIRYAVLVYVIFAIVQTIYYGLYFGAGWFLSRYLAPLSPLMILALVSVALQICDRFWAARGQAVVAGLGIASLVLSIGLLGWLAMPNVRTQGHFQVVDWVTKNVPAETWVGAVQTGTLGYWHDRTINLDGKVNPAALNAILAENHVLNYVLDSDIEYLADWWPLVTWVTFEGNQGVAAFSDGFAVVAEDRAANLGVLKRR